MSTMHENPYTVTYRAIGTIRSPFSALDNMPIQPVLSDAEGTVQLDEPYVEALDGLEGFSHAMLLYSLHKAAPYRSTVTPFLDNSPKGLFATRAPCRPNPIGLSIVRILSIVGSEIQISGADMLDGTPLLDIKPYVSSFDAHPDSIDGWLAAKRDVMKSIRSDGRFE